MDLQQPQSSSYYTAFIENGINSSQAKYSALLTVRSTHRTEKPKVELILQ